MLYHVTDVIFFGAIVPCKVQQCQNGNFVFDGNSAYRCTGQLSEFGDCNNSIKEPKRRPVEIPNEILEAYPFLNKEFNAENRVIMDNPKSLKTKTSSKPKRTPKTIRQKPQYEEQLVKGIN